MGNPPRPSSAVRLSYRADRRLTRELAGDREGDGADEYACLGRGRRVQRHDAVDADGADRLSAVSGDVVRSAAQARAARVGGSDRRGCGWLVGDRDLAGDDSVAWHEHRGEVGQADVLPADDAVRVTGAVRQV